LVVREGAVLAEPDPDVLAVARAVAPLLRPLWARKLGGVVSFLVRGKTNGGPVHGSNDRGGELTRVVELLPIPARGGVQDALVDPLGTGAMAVARRIGRPHGRPGGRSAVPHGPPASAPSDPSATRVHSGSCGS
ncbi:hypothetical protein THAOC_05236, partial [Thalassiosira oceanica]